MALDVYYTRNGHIKPQQVIEAMYAITKGDAIIATEVGQNQMLSLIHILQKCSRVASSWT